MPTASPSCCRGASRKIVEGSSVKIVDYAIVPSHKSSPSISRYTLLGLLLGAVVSCGVIVLMELFDEQIRDEDYVRQTFDLPLLAAVPGPHREGRRRFLLQNHLRKGGRSLKCLERTRKGMFPIRNTGAMLGGHLNFARLRSLQAAAHQFNVCPHRGGNGRVPRGGCYQFPSVARGNPPPP